MRTLFVLLLMCASASAQDFGWVLDDPFVWSVERSGDRDLAPQDSESRATDGPSFVHRINVVNRGGSATCIGPGVYITCKHIFEGLRGYQVSIDGQAVEADVTLAPNHDVAIVVSRSASTDSRPYVKFDVGSPEYMAECRAFGYGSEKLHKGVISNGDTLSLYAGESGIEQGDSGGAVFCDGVLVGVIRGKNPANSRVCYFTPLSEVASLLESFTPGVAVETSPSSEAATPSKPKLTIILPKTWVDAETGLQRPYRDGDCVFCGPHKQQDWSQFEVTHEQRDNVDAYPCTEWTDKRGVIRRLYGLRKPSAVMWSYRETMK